MDKPGQEAHEASAQRPLPLFPVVESLEDPRQISNIQTANARACFTADCDNSRTCFLKDASVNPFTPCNEWVTSKIAEQAGFTVLPSSVVSWGAKLFFGREYIPGPQLLLAPGGLGDSAIYNAINADEVCYEAIALDALVANPDRHHHNLIVTSHAKTGKRGLCIYLHDHDRALFGCNDQLAANLFGSARLNHFLADQVDGWDQRRSAWIRDDCTWHYGIKSFDRLLATAQVLTDLPDQLFEAITQQIPSDWISTEDRALLLRFLLDRKARLPVIIESRRALFPRLAS